MDIQNSTLFRDESTDDDSLQRKLVQITYNHFLNKKNYRMKMSIARNDLKEVPNHNSLKQQVQTKLKEHTTSSKPMTNYSWNYKYHHLLKLCELKGVFDEEDLPSTYIEGSICGHVFQIKQKETEVHTNYLTMFDVHNNQDQKYLLLTRRICIIPGI